MDALIDEGRAERKNNETRPATPEWKKQQAQTARGREQKKKKINERDAVATKEK